MVDIQSAAAGIRRGKKEDRRMQTQGKNIMSSGRACRQKNVAATKSSSS